MLKKIVAVTLIISTTGCAEFMQSMQKDPVRVENIGKYREKDHRILAIASFDASRRNLMVVLDGPNEGRFCAEPPADVALNVDSKTKAGGNVKNEKTDNKQELNSELSSEYKDTVTILAQRTALLDIYRTGTYSLCQYFLNGAVNQDEVSKQFFEFSQRVLDAYVKTIIENQKQRP